MHGSQDDLEPSQLTQCYKLSAVIAYKKWNSGALPVHVRSTYLQANGTGIDLYHTGLMLDYEHYVEQQFITKFDLKAHGPAGNRPRDPVDMQVDDLTCAESALV